MFGKLKEAFRSFLQRASDAIRYRELSDEEVSKLGEELFFKLVEADVAYEVAEHIVSQITSRLRGLKVPRGSDAKTYMDGVVREALLEILRRGMPQQNIVELIRARRPFKIVFFGVNGVGKTTTIAKIAYMLKQSGFRVLVVAADTFRAAAQEQLKKHCEKIGLELIQGKYGADPAAVAYDGVVYAVKRFYDVVLIDTAGRMHVDEDLVNELKKIVKVVNPDLRLLIIDALTGNDAVEQIKTFDSKVGIDGVILTKVDADIKGGAALSVIVVSSKPVYFLGVGQKYEDLIPYTPEAILDNLLK